MRCDHRVPVPEQLSREELLALLVVRDRQITELAGQLAELTEANQALAAKLAQVEHLLSRNSRNSSSPPSRDDGPGKPPVPEKPATPGRGGPKRSRGKQRGAPGSHLELVKMSV